MASRAACRADCERVPREEAQPAHGLDQRLHPRRLVAVAAEPLVEGHAGQGRDAVGERALAVLGQEEGGVPQSRHDDALHPPHHLGRGGAVAVRDGGEAPDAARVVAKRDRLLVVDEDGLEDLGGQRPELRRHLAHQHGRVLDEVAPLLAQAVVIPRAAARGGTELVLDPGGALLGSEDHEPLAQALVELVPGADVERPAPRAFRQEAVAAGRPAALDDDAALRPALGGVDGERHDLPVEEEHEPADRPPEREGAAPVVEPRVPGHALREREAAQDGGKEARQDLGGRAPGHLADVQQVDLARLRRVLGALAQVLDRDAVLLREPLRRARPLPRRVLRHLERRAPHGLLAVGLARRHVGPENEPSRGVAGGDLGRGEELAGRRLQEAGAQLLGEAGQPGGRHLLQADLEEELSHYLDSPPEGGGGTTASTYAFATAQASLRIFRIMPARSVTEMAPRASSTLKACELLRAQS